MKFILFFSQFLFYSRRILVPAAPHETRLGSLPHPFRPGVREALSTPATGQTQAGLPGLERRERQREPRLLQRLLSHSPAGPVQTRRLLFYLLFIVRLRGRGLLPGTAHSSAPATSKAATRGSERQRRRGGEGGAEGLGPEGQHQAEKSSQPGCKGQRQKLCDLLTAVS